MSHSPSQGASGRPATDVNILTIAATIAEDKTIRQSIADKTVLVPITATAVCALLKMIYNLFNKASVMSS